MNILGCESVYAWQDIPFHFSTKVGGAVCAYTSAREQTIAPGGKQVCNLYCTEHHHSAQIATWLCNDIVCTGGIAGNGEIICSEHNSWAFSHLLDQDALGSLSSNLECPSWFNSVKSVQECREMHQTPKKQKWHCSQLSWCSWGCQQMIPGRWW